MIEALLGLSVFALSLVLYLEIARRIQIETLLQFGCFVYTRQRALGVGHDTAQKKALAPWYQIFGAHRPFGPSFELYPTGVVRDLGAKAHIRYRSLASPAYWSPSRRRGETKHHFEVTARCWFPRSS